MDRQRSGIACGNFSQGNLMGVNVILAISIEALVFSALLFGGAGTIHWPAASGVYGEGKWGHKPFVTITYCRNYRDHITIGSGV